LLIAYTFDSHLVLFYQIFFNGHKKIIEFTDRTTKQYKVKWTLMVNFKKKYTFLQEVSTKGIRNRVSIIAQMPEFTRKELGLGPREFYSSPELIAAGTLEIMERYGIDGPYLDFDVYNIEPEGLGMEVLWSDESPPNLNYAKPIITDEKDLEKIKTPDFDSAGRFSHVLEIYHQYEKLTGGILPPFRCSAPFSLAANIRGVSNLLIEIFMKPDFIRGLLDRLSEEVIAPWLLRVKKEFPDLKEIGADDAFGSLPIVSPDILRDWVIPPVLKLRELVGPEVYVPNWVGEHYLPNPEVMLDMKKQVCPNFIRVQDPDVEILGPSIFKEYANRHNMNLCLGVGASFLDSATPVEVEERVKNYLQIGDQGDGLTIYLCTLSACTSPENVRAAVRAVRKYGTFSREER
jgi:uroporphyrinogen-III decarboxylase